MTIDSVQSEEIITPDNEQQVSSNTSNKQDQTDNEEDQTTVNSIVEIMDKEDVKNADPHEVTEVVSIVDEKDKEVEIKPEQILTHTFANVDTLKVGQERQSDSVIFVSNLPWTISIQRVQQTEGETSLGFYVSCNKGDKTDWSCEAVVEQRLLPVRKDIKIKAKRGCIDMYKTITTDMGYPKFLDWNDLIDVSKGYISNDGSVTFQITVDVKSVSRSDAVQSRVPKQTLTHTFTKVKEMQVGQNRASKSVMYINDRPWKIIIMRLKQENGESTLGLIASCNKDDKSDWNCEARVEYRVLPVKKNLEVKSWTGGIDKYSRLNPNYGVPDIFMWNEAVDNESGFISDEGSMTFQIIVETKAS